jgi:hypothetical protein
MITFIPATGEIFNISPIDETVSSENPSICVGGIREIILTCYTFSRFAAPYEIHPYSINIAISWSSTVVQCDCI